MDTRTCLSLSLSLSVIIQLNQLRCCWKIHQAMCSRWQWLCDHVVKFTRWQHPAVGLGHGAKFSVPGNTCGICCVCWKDSSISDIEEAFKGLTSRDDIAIILINQNVRMLPTVLKISKSFNFYHCLGYKSRYLHRPPSMMACVLQWSRLPR